MLDQLPPQRRPAPADPFGLFTRAEALGAGWSDAAVRHAIATGSWIRVARGVYRRAAGGTQRPADLITAANLRGLAAAKGCERAVLSHSSAAALHGLPTLGRRVRPCLTVPAATPLRTMADIHLHRAAITPDEVTSLSGSRLTSVSRTVVDVAREHGVDAGVASADAALRLGRTSRVELARAADRCRGWPGGRAARITADLADGGAESVLESLSRVRIGAAGLPAPTLQVAIGDQHGQFIARVDCYWPQFGVVGEADGNLKYDGGRTAIIAERRRQQRLEYYGLIVVRWEWSDLARFDAVAQRLRVAFSRGVAQGEGQRWSTV